MHAAVDASVTVQARARGWSRHSHSTVTAQSQHSHSKFTAQSQHSRHRPACNIEQRNGEPTLLPKSQWWQRGGTRHAWGEMFTSPTAQPPNPATPASQPPTRPSTDHPPTTKMMVEVIWYITMAPGASALWNGFTSLGCPPPPAAAAGWFDDAPLRENLLSENDFPWESTGRAVC